MNQLTDVAQSSLSSPQEHSPLEWVGMENMKVPLRGFGFDSLESRVSAFVSLSKADQRGIHMSRIYERIQKLAEHSIERDQLSKCLKDMISSQEGSSHAAKLVIQLHPILKRQALVSQKKGYKSYPVRLVALRKDQREKFSLSVSVDYSSTCPCSAALARESITRSFEEHFKNKNLDENEIKQFLLKGHPWPAWPHAQRSRATGHFLLEKTKAWPHLPKLIDQMEKALGTPTQTAVKRVDEQRFAQLNAENLMFCEDAARRLKSCFQSAPFQDFKFEVRHFESLHSHDVYAESRKRD